MKKDIPPEQIIIETATLLTTLKDRIERHSMEQSRGMERIWNELKEIRQISSEARDEEREARSRLESRIIKLETERNFILKFMVPLIATIFGAVSSFFTSIFHRGQ